jgi:hypothetical protein
MAEVIHRYVGKGGTLLPKEESADKKSDRAERAKWDAAFRKERTAHERTRRLERELKLAAAKGELIEKQVAARQVANLLVALKQRLLSIPESLPRCLEGRSAHEMREILHEAICDALREIARLPSTLTAERQDAGNGQDAKGAKSKPSKRRATGSDLKD